MVRLVILLVLLGLVTLITGSAQAVEPVTLWPLYQQQINMPCEWVGYSFGGTPVELAEQAADGCELAGMNRMWIPVRDPMAPYGAAALVAPWQCPTVTQRMRLDSAFKGLVVQFPTSFQLGNITVSLERLSNDQPEVIFRESLQDVPNEFQAKFAFPEQPPGDYVLRLTEPGGVIGCWLAPKLKDMPFELELAGKPEPGWFLEFATLSPDDQGVWHTDSVEHRYLGLGPWLTEAKQQAAYGIKSMFWVGNWNNGAFPYYPTWFYDLYPDITVSDAAGNPILETMFEEPKGWPSINHPVIVTGTRRYIKELVSSEVDNPDVIYWGLGGEALYPGYLRSGAGYGEYTGNAVFHFQAWLEQKYGSMSALNAAWGTLLGSFSEVTAPREQALSRRFSDWLDFSFLAMAERMSWHYAAVRSVDPKRPTVTANHGNIFWADAYAKLGADLPQYADASDGFEMGQIMEGDDPGAFNLWYASALAGLGKIGAPARLAYKFPDPKARGGSKSYNPAAARRYCMEAFGSGWWHLGLIQFSGSLPDGEWGVQGTPAQTEISHVFSDLKKLRPLAEGSWPVLPRLAFYFSQPQWRLLGWNPEWTGFHTWAIQHHFDHALLWEQQLLAGEAEPYKAVICAHNELVSPQALEALEGYVERGGRLFIYGSFALRDDTGKASPEAAAKLLARPGVTVLKGELYQAFGELERLLPEAGASPFVRVDSDQTVRWSLQLEPISGRHEVALPFQQPVAFGQTFQAPGVWLAKVALKTPTYRTEPKGFSMKMRLREGGPTGKVLIEALKPAEEFSDNVFAELSVDQPVTPNATYYVELQPERELEGLQLGLWYSAEQDYLGGQGYVAGQPQPWDFELRVDYAVDFPARMVTETFCLTDGASFLVPIINLVDEQIALDVALDPALIEGSAGEYGCYDALTGAELGEGLTTSISVSETGYRVLRFSPRGNKARTELQLRALQSHLEKGKASGFTLDYQTHWLNQAQAAFEAGEQAKSLGHSARGLAAPLAKPLGCGLTPSGDLEVELEVAASGGQPFTEALGVLRLVPLPDVRATFEEVAPGRYKALLPASALVAYDYELRQYVPYTGPMQVIANLWKGRELAQFSQQLPRSQ